MTEREMLEYAAKAAGYDCRWEADGDFINLEDGLPWKPRDDDGDSFRLMVALGVGVYIAPDGGCVAAGIPGEELFQVERITDGGDLCAATRHAIFRTAAEIGRNMP